MFNPNIRFSADEWQHLVTNRLEPIGSIGKLLQCLARIPGLRDCLQDPLLYEENLTKAREVNTTVLAVLDELRKPYKEAEEQCRTSDQPKIWNLNRMVYANAQRMYGIALFAACYTNSLLRSLSPAETCLELRQNAKALALDIIELAGDAMPLRPMGTAFVLICLLGAWVSTTEEVLQSQIEGLYMQYASDHANEQHAPLDKDGHLSQCIVDSGMMVPDSAYSP